MTRKRKAVFVAASGAALTGGGAAGARADGSQVDVRLDEAFAKVAVDADTEASGSGQ